MKAYHSHRCSVFIISPVYQWLLISNLEVEIYNLVCECGEFVTEAEFKDPSLIWCPCKTIILFLNIFV